VRERERGEERRGERYTIRNKNITTLTNKKTHIHAITSLNTLTHTLAHTHPRAHTHTCTHTLAHTERETEGDTQAELQI